MTSEWIKGSTSQGKFPEKAFSAKLNAICPGTVGEKDTLALKLDFEGDTQLAIFGLNKVENGIAPGFMGIGKFLDSLTAHKIEYFWGIQGTEILDFKTEPDIVGAKLYMKPTESKQIGEKQKVFLEWIVEKIEYPAGVKPGKLPSKPEPIEDLTEKWKEVLKSMPTPLNEAGLARYLKVAISDDKLRKSMSDARKKVLESLVINGFLDIDDGKYKVI